MIFRIPGKKDHPKTDEELINEFSSTGNIELLGKVYSEYMHLVYGVCLKYLEDRDESKDAVMQIFEKIASELPGQKIGNFRGWLYVVTRNYCLMQLRSEKVKNKWLKDWSDEQVIFMENINSVHPIDEDGEERAADLEECINGLKDEQRECIRLFYYGNRSYKDIAGDLMIDEKKVKSHLQNAKRNLKICLEDKDAEREKQ